MATIQSIDSANLQAICDVLGDTGGGLTGSEIGRLLREAGIADPEPSTTKRHRLFEALSQRQTRDGCANNVLAFVQAAMNPVRYVGNNNGYEVRRNDLNRCLAFSGLQVRPDGTFVQVDAARTLPDAEQRASRLRADLISRQVHPDVVSFCRSELLQDNYFHAVFEAAKSVAEKIREKTGLGSDGAALIDAAFGLGARGIPMLAFNTLRTDTERSEQTGLMNLMKGLFGAFRNALAHAPKVKWSIGEQDALDILSLCSLLHRRLDAAVRTP